MIVMRNLLTLSVLAVMVALIACTHVGGDAFVRHEGMALTIGGKPYHFVGANLWYGAILASEGQGGDRKRLCAELDSLHALGLDNLRVLVGSDGLPGRDKVSPTLQQAPGQYNDTILAGLDFLLSEMAKRGMHAVLYLNNAWEWSGGYGYYLEQTGQGKTPLPNVEGYEAYCDYVAQFAANDSAHQLFYDYVRFIVTRTNRYTGRAYVDDPTIMAWQIGNEPRPFGEPQYGAFAQWLSEASALIRSLDGNHLISVGGEGIVGCEGDTALFERISADPNIDYITVHIWPTTWQWARKDSCQVDVDLACQKSREYMDAHIAVARRLGKPIVIEEFGYPRDNFSFDPASPVTGRDRYYDFILTLCADEPAVAGCNFWAWGGMALPRHERWQPGAPYLGDPAQEPQGLFSVFITDTTTLKILSRLSFH